LTTPDIGSGHLRRRDGEPIFHEPWHAQVLAIADLLITSGTISHVEWTETLGLEITEARRLNQDDAETYFRAVLYALERLLVAERKVSRSELEIRRGEWERAYLCTPHGQPVELDRGG
jgi:hypothetical protein